MTYYPGYTYPYYSAGTTGSEWLLSPTEIKTELIDLDKKLRVNTRIIFGLMWEAISGEKDEELDFYSVRLKDECRTILEVLSDDRNGPGIPEFRKAWFKNDHDWFHAQFMRLGNYRECFELISAGMFDTLKFTHGSYLTLARALGQVARISSDRLIVGSAPLKSRTVQNIFDIWPWGDVPTLHTSKLSEIICAPNGVTPFRLNKALLNYRSNSVDFPEEVKSKYVSGLGFREEVIFFTTFGYSMIDAYSESFFMDDKINPVISFRKI